MGIVVIEKGEEGASLVLPVGQPVDKFAINRAGMLSIGGQEPAEHGLGTGSG